MTQYCISPLFSKKIDLESKAARLAERGSINTCTTLYTCMLSKRSVPFRTHPLLPFGGWVELSIP
jgi:hypothetical protein